jgi:hypothetical protein
MSINQNKIMQEIIKVKRCNQCPMFWRDAEHGVIFCLESAYRVGGDLYRSIVLNKAIVNHGIDPQCPFDNNELITYKIVKDARD